MAAARERKYAGLDSLPLTFGRVAFAGAHPRPPWNLRPPTPVEYSMRDPLPRPVTLG